jgi:hypothetical protein
MPREPYVDGETLSEAYRSSAQIDREEADTLIQGSLEYDTRMASAAEFEDLATEAEAAELEAEEEADHELDPTGL